ncbi:MAG: hypothetical protein LVS60_14650 [Nodosilinea sp. LVE1205-7]
MAEAICRQAPAPQFLELEPGHHVACHAVN